MKNNPLFILLTLALFLPRYILADAPPPPPFLVNFTYEGQKITDEKFYAVVLECEEGNNPDVYIIPQLNINQPNVDGKCNWLPHALPYSDRCADSRCNFNWVMGDFKLAAYIPSLDKTFVSDVITREYLGHYGRKTQTVYDVNLSKDSGITVNNVMVVDNANSIFDTSFFVLMTISFIATVILESVVVLVFFLLKKAPGRIFLALLIGNLLSVPFIWTIAGIFPFFTGFLYLAEIIVVIFEAWFIRLFGRKTLSWKMSLLISLIMNVASFIVGPYLIFLSGLF